MEEKVIDKISALNNILHATTHRNKDSINEELYIALEAEVLIKLNMLIQTV